MAASAGPSAGGTGGIFASGVSSRRGYCFHLRGPPRPGRRPARAGVHLQRELLRLYAAGAFPEMRTGEHSARPSCRPTHSACRWAPYLELVGQHQRRLPGAILLSAAAHRRPLNCLHPRERRLDAGHREQIHHLVEVAARLPVRAIADHVEPTLGSGDGDVEHVRLGDHPPPAPGRWGSVLTPSTRMTTSASLPCMVWMVPEVTPTFERVPPPT